jgi:hypothetical protein
MESLWMLFMLFGYGGHNWREWGGSIDGSQRLLRRSSSGSQVPDFVCCLERIVEFGLEIRECRLENTC